MAAAIPRGVLVIDWKNAGKYRSIRYRVRAERDNFCCRPLFSDLERAKLFLECTKTPQGRLFIAQGRDRATLMGDVVERLAVEFIKEGRCTLSHAIDSYLRVYVNPKLESEVDKDRLMAKAAKGCLQFCLPS